MRNLHHQPHVMLDQHDGDALPRDGLDDGVDLLRLDRVAAGRRLVEQQHLRRGRERARDLQPLERAVSAACRPSGRPHR